MRATPPIFVFGLLAWLPACRNQTFESCAQEGPNGCVQGSTEAVTATHVDDTSVGVPQASANGSSTDSAPAAPTTDANGDAPEAGVSLVPAPPDDGGGGGVTPPGPVPTEPAQATASEATAEVPSTAEPEQTSAAVSSEAMYTFGDSLVSNGDFAEGNDFWSIERVSGGVVSSDFDDETLCVSSRGNTQAIIGWPKDPSDGMVLSPGRYQFSFRVRGRGAHVWAKVGHAHEPFDVHFESEWSGDEAGWHDVIHEFEFEGDDAAGLAFHVDLTFSADTVCLDDVALRAAVPIQ